MSSHSVHDKFQSSNNTVRHLCFFFSILRIDLSLIVTFVSTLLYLVLCSTTKTVDPSKTTVNSVQSRSVIFVFGCRLPDPYLNTSLKVVENTSDHYYSSFLDHCLWTPFSSIPEKTYVFKLI